MLRVRQHRLCQYLPTAQHPSDGHDGATSWHFLALLYPRALSSDRTASGWSFRKCAKMSMIEDPILTGGSGEAELPLPYVELELHSPCINLRLARNTRSQSSWASTGYRNPPERTKCESGRRM